MSPRSRSIASFALTFVVLTLFAAPSASADTTLPSTYSAKANAVALQLNVFGQGITLGFTHAENASDPSALARGLGALVPGLGNQQDITAAANNDTPSADNPLSCGPITLPNDFPVVSLASACSSATAVVSDTFPSSEGNAAVANVDVNAADVLTQLGGQVNPAIGDALSALQPLFYQLNDQGIDAQTLLSNIISAITEDGDLVRIALGPSKSTSSADAATETATGTAQGAVIEVLPRDSLNLQPVLTIEVGAATNTITIDRNTAQATVNYLPSLVKITIADDIATALSLTDEQKTVSVSPGASQTKLLPAPLTSCIGVASGTQGVTDDGVTHAEASGVSLQLLQGVQNGITLNLAGTSVQGVGALETTREAPPEAPGLARTGGTDNSMFAATLFGVGMVGFTLTKLSRRRIFHP